MGCVKSHQLENLLYAGTATSSYNIGVSQSILQKYNKPIKVMVVKAYYIEPPRCGIILIFNQVAAFYFPPVVM